MKSRYEEIVEQIRGLQREAAVVRAEEVRLVIEEIQAKVQAFGLTPDDIFSRRKPTAIRGVRVTIKYRDEKGNAWSGRGKTPKWLSDAIAAGRSKESFLVNPPPGDAAS